MQILQLAKEHGGKNPMTKTKVFSLNRRKGMELWDEKRYNKEKEKMRALFLNDPEVRDFVSWVLTLKAYTAQYRTPSLEASSSN